MYDKNLVCEIIKNICWSLDLIQNRSKNINSYEDFLDTDDGIEKLDSICMQIINIGEAIKQIDKITSTEFLLTYPEVDWKAVKGMRDIITHHYFDIDAEVVYTTIKDKIPQLHNTINKIKDDLKCSKI